MSSANNPKKYRISFPLKNNMNSYPINLLFKPKKRLILSTVALTQDDRHRKRKGVLSIQAIQTLSSRRIIQKH